MKTPSCTHIRDCSVFCPPYHCSNSTLPRDPPHQDVGSLHQTLLLTVDVQVAPAVARLCLLRRDVQLGRCFIARGHIVPWQLWASIVRQHRSRRPWAHSRAHHDGVIPAQHNRLTSPGRVVVQLAPICSDVFLGMNRALHGPVVTRRARCGKRCGYRHGVDEALDVCAIITCSSCAGGTTLPQ